MATFKDRNGKDWIIEFDGPLIEEANKILHLDIADENGEGMLEVCKSNLQIINAAWIFCEAQAREAGIDMMKFHKMVNKGEVVSAIETALRQALTDFTRPSRRGALTAILNSQDKVNDAAQTEKAKAANDPKTMELLTKAIQDKMAETVKEMETQIRASQSSANASPDTAIAAPTA